MENQQPRVCPVEHAGMLVSRVRRWLQDPRKIVAPFVRDGMTVLDVGCGPGFFSVELARLVGPAGRVIAADLQEGMLEKLRDTIRGTELEERIQPVKSDSASINVSTKVDFALAFYMVHEVPDKASLFAQVARLLKENGAFLVVEPKLFHVSRRDFRATMAIAERAGFLIAAGPRLLLSWSAVLRRAGSAATTGRA